MSKILYSILLLGLTACSNINIEAVLRNSNWKNVNEEAMNFVTLEFTNSELIGTSIGDTVFRYSLDIKSKKIILTNNRLRIPIKVILVGNDSLKLRSSLIIGTYVRTNKKE